MLKNAPAPEIQTNHQTATFLIQETTKLLLFLCLNVWLTITQIHQTKNMILIELMQMKLAFWLNLTHLHNADVNVWEIWIK